MAVKSITTVPDISELDLAWLAGLLEGEGSFILRTEPGPNGDKSKRLVRGSIQMKSTDEDVIRRVADITGGSMWGPMVVTSHPDWKPVWEWRVNASVDVLKLAAQLYPFLGIRRGRKVCEMLYTSYGVHKVDHG